MTNQLLNNHIKSIHNGLKMSTDAVSNYLDNWFAHLPLNGKQHVMDDYKTPEFDEFNPEYYEVAVSEYEDILYHEFSQSAVRYKLNDFDNHAIRYSDVMLNNFKF